PRSPRSSDRPPPRTPATPAACAPASSSPGARGPRPSTGPAQRDDYAPAYLVLSFTTAGGDGRGAPPRVPGALGGAARARSVFGVAAPDGDGRDSLRV